MTESVKFDCPRCHRSYELNASLGVAKSKHQWAKCARCGERFEIANRVEALLADSSQAAMELSSDYSRTVADTRISARLAAALLASNRENQNAELIAKPGYEGQVDGAGGRSAGPASVTRRFRSPLQSAAWQEKAQSDSEQPSQKAAQEAAQEVEEEANLPVPLDWIARAGAGPEILHRQLGERERELTILLASDESSEK